MVWVRSRTRRCSLSVSRRQPVVALGPAGVVLALVAAVAGVRAQLGAQLEHLGVVGGRRPGRCGARRRRAVGQAGVAQGGRQVAARLAGLRGLKVFGIRIRSSASTGTGKSASESRRTCRSAVSTVGRGPSRAGRRAGVEHHRQAARRPAGTWMTSPGRSFSSEAAACGPAVAPRRCAAAPPRGPQIARRSPAYSSKSPRWQVIASR